MRVRVFRLPDQLVPHDLFYIPSSNSFYMPFTGLSSREAIVITDLDEDKANKLKAYQTIGQQQMIEQINTYEIDIEQPANVEFLIMKVRPQDVELVNDKYSYYELLFSHCEYDEIVIGLEFFSIVKQIGDTEFLCIAFTDTSDANELDYIYKMTGSNILELSRIGINQNEYISLNIELFRL